TGALSKLKGATTNPVKIDPFFDNYSGEITVSVTDGNGLEAEMTRVISANDFPYVPYIVVKPTSNTDTDPVTATNTVTDTGTVTDTDTAMGDPLDIPPAGTVLDPGTGLLWQDNDEHIRMKWSQAEFFCEDVLDQGGYADWRLPTLAELEIAYQHRDIFTAYAKLGYWSSDKYTYKSTKDHSDDRSDKYQSSKGHSDKDHDEQSRYWNLRFKSGSKRVADAHDKNAVRCVRDW
ncbi:MAG: DUF1566 domain-containing protein, partial [SAR324 cluster bacterium]|nr:DUF1566 domain-containing protein [SAR324 cluster bacterium]